MSNSQLATCIFQIATRNFIFLNSNSQLTTHNSFCIHFISKCAILDKRLETNSQNWAKQVLLWNFYSWFFAIFYQKTSKFGFWLDGQAFQGFFGYFLISLDLNLFFFFFFLVWAHRPPQRRKCRGVDPIDALDPILKSFGNLWSNSYIHFLVIII